MTDTGGGAVFLLHRYEAGAFGADIDYDLLGVYSTEERAAGEAPREMTWARDPQNDAVLSADDGIWTWTVQRVEVDRSWR